MMPHRRDIALNLSVMGTKRFHVIAKCHSQTTSHVYIVLMIWARNKY